MARTPEAKVKDAVKKVLKDADCYYYMVVPCGFSTVGVPDFICCVPTTITQDMVGMRLGIFAGVETKALGKVLNTTPNQKKSLSEIGKAGGMAIVADNALAVKDCIDILRNTGIACIYIP